MTSNPIAEWPSALVQICFGRVNVTVPGRSVLEVAKHLWPTELFSGCLNTDKEIP